MGDHSWALAGRWKFCSALMFAGLVLVLLRTGWTVLAQENHSGVKVGGLQVGARVIPTPTTVSPELARFIDSAGSMTDYKILSSAAG